MEGRALMLVVAVLAFAKGSHADEIESCGMTPLRARIIGGNDAAPASWPWQVSINYIGSFQYCGGSLINNQWVLTAAHCIESDVTNTTVVFLGRLDQRGDNPHEAERRVAMAVCHPAYDPFDFDNDVCLLMLDEPVEFTDYIQPVCLAASGSVFHTGTPSYVTGWGTNDTDFFTFPDILQEVEVPVVGNRQCECYLGYLVSEEKICAGFMEGGRDSCQGDSGGPMVVQHSSVWIQAGVVSFGIGCAEPMSPGGYARVSRYQDWILSIIDENRPMFVPFMSEGVDSDDSFVCDDDTIFNGGEGVAHFAALVWSCAAAIFLLAM